MRRVVPDPKPIQHALGMCAHLCTMRAISSNCGQVGLFDAQRINPRLLWWLWRIICLLLTPGSCESVIATQDWDLLTRHQGVARQQSDVWTRVLHRVHSKVDVKWRGQSPPLPNMPHGHVTDIMNRRLTIRVNITSRRAPGGGAHPVTACRHSLVRNCVHTSARHRAREFFVANLFHKQTGSNEPIEEPTMVGPSYHDRGVIAV
jgi:hypothetical protein